MDRIERAISFLRSLIAFGARESRRDFATRLVESYQRFLEVEAEISGELTAAGPFEERLLAQVRPMQAEALALAEEVRALFARHLIMPAHHDDDE